MELEGWLSLLCEEAVWISNEAYLILTPLLGRVF